MLTVRNPENTDIYPTRFSTLLDRFFNDTVGNANRLNNFVPSVDIAETADKYEVHLAVPGMKKEDFKVEVQKNTLTISGERKFESKEEGKTFHKVETSYGSFTRSFSLPETVKADSIQAEYKDGLLTLVLPKDTAKTATTQVQIK